MVLQASPALAQDETRLTDSGKKFHRLFIQGNGSPGPDGQDGQIARDTNLVRAALTAPGTQAAGSTSATLVQPDSAAVVNHITVTIKNVAAVGDEVTIYFKGHGNHDFVRLNGAGLASSDLTADQLDAALDQLPAGVTVVVMLDSCFGGSFADNIGESDTKKVIGTKTKCWFDPANALWAWWHDTFSEDMEEKLDDGGVISGQQLKDYLSGQSWDLGVPGAGETKPKKGKSQCTCPVKPALSGPSSGAVGSNVTLSGSEFASSGTVEFSLVAASGSTTAFGSATLSSGGFAATVAIPSVAAGPYLLVADDGTHQDWIDDFVVTPGGGGGSVPSLSNPAAVLLAALLVLGGLLAKTRLSVTRIQEGRD